MRLSALLISVFVISMFSAGFLGFYGYMLSGVNSLDANTTRNFNINDTTNASYIVSNMTSILNDTQTSGIEAGNVNTDSPYNLLTGAFNAVYQAFTLPFFFQNLLKNLVLTEFGVPAWFTDGVSAIIVIIVIVGLIKFFAGRDF